MTAIPKSSSALALCAALFAPLAASAHSIWFAQRAGDLALIYGHGAEDLSVIKRIDKVTGVGAFDGAGQPVAVTLKRTDTLAFVDSAAAPAIVTATMDNGLWSHGPDDQWLNKGKDEVPGAKKSGRYLKYASHLRTLPAGPLAPLPGPGLQVLPVSAKFPQRAGQPLTLRVLLDGKPAVGARVLVDLVNDPDAKPLLVPASGLLTLRVRNQGLNVIEAELEAAPADAAKADKTVHTATLSFVLAHQPE